MRKKRIILEFLPEDGQAPLWKGLSQEFLLKLSTRAFGCYGSAEECNLTWVQGDRERGLSGGDGGQDLEHKLGPIEGVEREERGKWLN